MPRQGKALKLTPANATALGNALDKLAPHVAAAAESWSELTPEQRQALLAHSPILARLIALALPFREV